MPAEDWKPRSTTAALASICTRELPRRTSREILDAAQAWETEAKDSLRPAGLPRPSNAGRGGVFSQPLFWYTA
ncbi:hypothetical protein NUW54_g3115 [Trametes sanguinea]|uniref:Uncharacterized protein n=1 Tax=Trametes sanguinea TaxID=158606 RepID=A0ACC1Q339_9APHY|nr:hypothetical protein NUW54_g3115 [Trametes sanguinea]